MSYGAARYLDGGLFGPPHEGKYPPSMIIEHYPSRYFLYEGYNPIPEPATLSLLCLGALAMWKRRR